MHSRKPFGPVAHLRPFAATRHRLRHGLKAALMRDDPMALACPLSEDVMSDIPAAARREIRARAEGGQA